MTKRNKGRRLPATRDHEKAPEPSVDTTTDPPPPEAFLPGTEMAAAPSPEGDAWATRLQGWQDERDRRYQGVKGRARAIARAMVGWETLDGEAGWAETLAAAQADYAAGTFLIERLGAERFLDPPLMAVLLTIRQQLIEDTAAQGMQELLLVDLAVLSYYNVLRIQGWVGNAAMWLEHEFFGQPTPSAAFERRYGRQPTGLAVEERVQRLTEQFLPLLDRANRMLIKNLTALRELKHGPAPAVAIAQAGQVNVANRQINLSSPTAVPAGGEPTPDEAGSRPVGQALSCPHADDAPVKTGEAANS